MVIPVKSKFIRSVFVLWAVLSMSIHAEIKAQKAFQIDDITVVDVSLCYGNANGSITITASGGTEPYKYSVDGGSSFQLSNVFSGLTADTYIIKVQDHGGQTVSDIRTLTEPPEIFINDVSTVDVADCHGDLTGEIHITASSGTPPYTYSIDNGTTYFSNGGDFLGIAAGNYTIKVKDANDCVKPGPFVTVEQPVDLVITAIGVVDVFACYGHSTGSIEILATGGTPTIQYSIDGGTTYQTGKYFGGLSAGTYPVMIEDGNGCNVDGGTVEILQPDELVINSEIPTDVNTCHGDDSGTITINASGGTGQLQYSVDNGGFFQVSNVFNNLYAGNYTIAVRDQNYCTASGSSITINEPTQVVIDSESFSDVVGCFGDATGEILVSASGGTGTMNYSIDNGTTFQGSGTFSNLLAGTYQVYVEDDNQCGVTGSSFFIQQPTKLIADNADGTDVASCYGAADGTITILAYGGSSPIEYSVDNGAAYVPNSHITGLTAGTYHIKVRDVAGCLDSIIDPVILSQPDELQITSEITQDPTCYGYTNGQITMTATGGSGTLYYSVDNGTTFYVENVVTGLSAGVPYQVVVLDGNNCTVNGGLYTLVSPQELVISKVVHQDVTTCAGGSNGTIDITATGGTGQLYYSINGGVSYSASGAFSGLSEGNYQVMVKDDNDCIVSGDIVTIFDPDQVAVNHVFHENIETCAGDATGSITVQASGGTAPLSYSIDNGATYFNNGGLFTNLIAGVYPVRVRDINDCNISGGTVIVEEPDTLKPELTSKEDILCNGNNNGKIIITAIGGEHPYQYSIDGGVTYGASNVFSNLSQGTYQTYVRDSYMCAQPGPLVEITEPPALLINSIAVQQVEQCYGQSTGSITIDAQGGVPDILYSINYGSSFVNNGGLFHNLTAGTYQVQITDANNCLIINSDPIIITQPDELFITGVSKLDITCFGDDDGIISLTAQGGTGVLEYSINGGIDYQLSSDFTDLSPGVYPIMVRDENGCTKTEADVILYEPDELIIADVEVNDELCVDSEDGSIVIFADGGTQPYQFSSDGVNFQSYFIISDLAPGTYTPYVQDINNCLYEGEPVTISSPENSSGFVADPFTGCSPLEVSFTTTGPGETYLWRFGDGNTSFNTNPTHTFVNLGLTEQQYTVWSFAFSENGCIDSSSTVINVSPRPRLLVSVLPDTLYFPNSTFTVNNESPSGYTNYLWDFGDGTQSTQENPTTHTYETCGTYDITASAQNEWCSDTVETQVSVVPNIPISRFEPDTTESCFPVTINFTNNSEYEISYLWDFGDGESSTDPNPVKVYEEPGTYSVSLSVEGYCNTDDVSDTLIYVYNSPQIDFSVQPDSVMPPNQPVHCYNYSSGYDLQYLWDFGNGDTSTEQSPEYFYQREGEYTIKLTVTTGNGCIDSLVSISTVYVYPYGHIEMPNAFTPDNNGENDVFKPGAYDSMAEYRLMIYNRWGEKVFETTDPDEGWDGNFEGMPATQDVYVWKIIGKYRNGTPFELAGDLILLK